MESGWGGKSLKKLVRLLDDRADWPVPFSVQEEKARGDRKAGRIFTSLLFFTVPDKLELQYHNKRFICREWQSFLNFISWGGHRQGKKKSAICRLFRAPYFFVGSLSPFCRLLSLFCRLFVAFFIMKKVNWILKKGIENTVYLHRSEGLSKVNVSRYL